MENESNVSESPADEQVEKTEKSKKSKRRNKNKKSGESKSGEEIEQQQATTSQLAENGPPQLTSMDKDMLKQLKALNLDEIMKVGKEAASATTSKYKFWNTQPVPKIDEGSSGDPPAGDYHKAIEADKTIAEIKQEPYQLPEGFVWETLHLDNETVLRELYTLLNENYVEDDDAMFRFDYQPEFLRWALQPPRWLKDWHVGVRVAKSGRLIAFISAIPAEIKVFKKSLKVVEINFLCVHKKLRSKRLAPVLIREITRRVNLTGIFQAVYTAGVVLPKPVTTCRYWHRSLNPKKLIDVSFS